MSTVLQIGRAEDNNIILPSNAAGVGRHHAKITIAPSGDMTIQDLNTVNGTYVNDELVQGIRGFGPNDHIRLGKSFEFSQSLLAKYRQQNQGSASQHHQFVRCSCGAVIQSGSRCDRCGR